MTVELKPSVASIRDDSHLIAICCDCARIIYQTDQITGMTTRIAERALVDHNEAYTHHPQGGSVVDLDKKIELSRITRPQDKPHR